MLIAIYQKRTRKVLGYVPLKEIPGDIFQPTIKIAVRQSLWYGTVYNFRLKRMYSYQGGEIVKRRIVGVIAYGWRDAEILCQSLNGFMVNG